MSKKNNNNNNNNNFTRRDMIKMSATAFAVGAMGATALSPLGKALEKPSIDELLQHHYKELNDEDKKKIFQRLENEYKEKYGVKFNIKDPKPLKGVEFAMVINLGRCIGCRKCVYACMKENNTSRDPQIQYIRVLKMKKGSINLEEGKHDYKPEEAMDDNFFYMPVQCHQCRKPPCTEVCPVEATFKQEDGIVVVDYNWCIGCRYCEAACPYHARRFNWTVPHVPSEDMNTNVGYLSNRPRYMGVMEKCTFCLHRTREGRYTACTEVCPTGTRKFGNLLDPNSEVRKLIENERVFVLKQELHTLPHLYYTFSRA